MPSLNMFARSAGRRGPLSNSTSFAPTPAPLATPAAPPSPPPRTSSKPSHPAQPAQLIRHTYRSRHARSCHETHPAQRSLGLGLPSTHPRHHRHPSASSLDHSPHSQSCHFHPPLPSYTLLDLDTSIHEAIAAGARHVTPDPTPDARLAPATAAAVVDARLRASPNRSWMTVPVPTVRHYAPRPVREVDATERLYGPVLVGEGEGTARRREMVREVGRVAARSLDGVGRLELSLNAEFGKGWTGGTPAPVRESGMSSVFEVRAPRGMRKVFGKLGRSVRR